MLEALKAAAIAIDGKFAKNITAIDISDSSSVADYFLIAEASNPNQINAIVRACEEALIAYDIKLRHIEGLVRGEWTLMDFGDIVAHIFSGEAREFYGLEKTWGDCPRVSLDIRES